jgi:anti-sigma-K factor RskA
MLLTKSRYELGPVPLLGASYGMIVGIKFLLALPIFLFASFLAGRSATAKKFQASAPFWMNVNLALALVMVLIGGLLKFVPRTYKTEPAAAAVISAAAESETASQILPFRDAAE